ncbi:hypothetical protein EV368DRAFT_89054 [Lentinula lateritia]|nr:hypothetical protein EV368DRAFT_89054 [Lentinula lateritia]
MHVSFTLLGFLLLLEGTFASPLVAKRSPKDLSKKVFLGYRAIDSTTAARYNREHRLVYKRTVSTQLGDGAYLTRRLGDWTASNVCAVYADAKRLASVKKLWLDYDKRESPVREEVIKTQFKMKDIHKFILTSGIWGSDVRDSDVQMLIPPYFLADKDSSGKLGIYVICVPWDSYAELPTNEDADWESLSIVGYPTAPA